MDTLFGHVHEATRRTLAANGYRVIEVTGQRCCGALHDHAGDQAGAARLARANLAAFAESADFIVVNSAGCFLLKDYGYLLGSESGQRPPPGAGRHRIAPIAPAIGGPIALDGPTTRPAICSMLSGLRQPLSCPVDPGPGQNSPDPSLLRSAGIYCCSSQRCRGKCSTTRSTPSAASRPAPI
jgi:hypothetical protein